MFFLLFAMFPCWTYFVRLAGSSQVMKHLHLILMWKPPHPPPPPKCSCQLFTFQLHSGLFDSYKSQTTISKINTLNACNHLATSYSHIRKTCAFDYCTNTCININFSWAVLFVIKTFFLNAPIQKFMHHFNFFSGILE